VKKGDTVAEISISERNTSRKYEVEKTAPKEGHLVPLTTCNRLYIQPQFGGPIALISDSLFFGGRKQYEIVKPATSWLGMVTPLEQYARFAKSLKEGDVKARGDESFVWGRMMRNGTTVKELRRTKTYDAEAIYYLIEDGKKISNEKGRMGAVFLEVLPDGAPRREREPLSAQEALENLVNAPPEEENQKAIEESESNAEDEEGETISEDQVNGYVYVLKHPQMPDLVKVGSTERTPEERAEELSSATGVPGPFQVVFRKPARRPLKAELKTHRLLSEYRWSPDREFFEISEKEAVEAIEEVTPM
jgi:hypothetical protein